MISTVKVLSTRRSLFSASRGLSLVLASTTTSLRLDSVNMGRPKRKSSALAQEPVAASTVPVPDAQPPPAKRQARSKAPKPSTNPNTNKDVLDGAEALRASPDAEEKDERVNVEKMGMRASQIKTEDDSPPSLVPDEESASSLSDMSDVESPTKPSLPAKGAKKNTAAPKPAVKKEEPKPQFLDPDAEGEEEADEEELKEALSRPPPVNSDYLPLPWKGRIGYACLNTYLRFSNPPVFSSRTCRIASILENRNPLKNPDEAPHATKNRPDMDQPADIARGQAYVEALGLANARDITKMLRWNDRYNIKFMRLSSEMFPFASHEEYGYKLAPFASETLAQVGKVVAELGHRVTTHPGQVRIQLQHYIPIVELMSSSSPNWARPVSQSSTMRSVILNIMPNCFRSSSSHLRRIVMQS